MARKNKRHKTEYRKGLGFDPRKYISASEPYHICKETDSNPQRGDIWFADLGIHPSTNVQGGVRPVIIISNNRSNSYAGTVNIIPMTRTMKKPEMSCHTHIFPGSISDIRQHLEPSMVLTEQLTTVSKSKLRSYVGHISDADAMNRIETAVISQLHLERRYQECL